MASNNYIYKMSNAGGMATVTRYTDMLAGNTTWNPWEPQGALDALSTVTVGATAVSSIMFAGLPTTYKHLQIRILARTNGSGQDRGSIALKFNADTTSANYSWHSLIGDGSAASATGGATSGTSNYIGGISAYTAANATTSIFGVGIIDVLDYSNISKAKTVRTLAGQDQNGTSGRISLNSGRWGVNDAINSIELLPEYGSFIQNTQFTLYGVK